MYFLGIDLGSTSIKLSVFDPEKGITVGSVTVPEFEINIIAPKFGCAEQDPNSWWQNVNNGTQILGTKHSLDLKQIAGIEMLHTNAYYDQIMSGFLFSNLKLIELTASSLRYAAIRNDGVQVVMNLVPKS